MEIVECDRGFRAMYSLGEGDVVDGWVVAGGHELVRELRAVKPVDVPRLRPHVKLQSHAILVNKIRL